MKCRRDVAEEGTAENIDEGTRPKRCGDVAEEGTAENTKAICTSTLFLKRSKVH